MGIRFIFRILIQFLWDKKNNSDLSYASICSQRYHNGYSFTFLWMPIGLQPNTYNRQIDVKILILLIINISV